MNAHQPGGARDQVSRLLTLVPLLHTRGALRVEDAAALLGVTSEQLVTDLKVLLMCGLPGGYPDDLIDVDLDALEEPHGDGVIRVSNAEYLTRPLRLTPTEATAVIVALRALRNGAQDETREVVDRALAKLEAAAADGTAAGRVDPGTEAGDPAEGLLATRLQDAADRQRQVLLRYYVPSRDELSERTVDPRGVVTHRGVAYLDAWCHSAAAPRLFRLERIEHAEVTDAPLETTPEPPRDLAAGLFSHATDATTATLLLRPEARWMVEYYPVLEVRPAADGALEVDLVVVDEAWLTRLLLRLAPHARVLAPAGLADDFRAAARQVLGLYGSPA